MLHDNDDLRALNIEKNSRIMELESQVHVLESDMSKILEAAKIDGTVITKLNDKIAKLQSGLKPANTDSSPHTEGF